MKTNLLFEFTVNKENKTIVVNREFDAELKLVWQACTVPELLEQWWAPKPWRAETKSMDFREGGHWLYAMVGPKGERHWNMVNYISIEKEKYFKAKDGFSDEDGTINVDLPQSLWENRYVSQKDQTLVIITLTFDTLEDLETIIKMGFKEGFIMGLNQLDELLTKLKNRTDEE